MSKRILLIIFCILLIVGCSKKPANNNTLTVTEKVSSNNTITEEDDDATSTVNQFIESGLPIISSDKAFEDIKTFGTPLRIEEKLVSGSGVSDVPLKIYYFNDIEISIIGNEDNDRSFVLSFLLTSNKYKPLYNINTGSTKESIENILGKPNEYNEKEDCFTYISSAGAEQYVYLYFKENKVYRIAWMPYVD